MSPAGITPGGRPILVRGSPGLYQTDFVEIRDAQGALVATIRYSEMRPPDARTRVWVDVEPTALVSITDRCLPVEDRTESPQEA